MAQIYYNIAEHGSDAECLDLFHQQTQFRCLASCSPSEHRKNPNLAHRGLGRLTSANTILMHRGHSNKKAGYKMRSVKLQSTPVEKDLGVFVGDSLKFRDHVSYAVNKASRLLRLIRMTFFCIDEDTLPRLLTTLVRPHLEYGNIIWHPRYRIDKIQIEKMQR